MKQGAWKNRGKLRLNILFMFDFYFKILFL
jgi:hypothetical protein